MQKEVALSKTEAEYIALSQSIRDLIPIRDIVAKISPHIMINRKDINDFTNSIKSLRLK